MPLFIIILAAFYLLGNGYIYFRSWEVLQGLSTLWRWVLSIGYWSCACAFFYIFGNRNLPETGTWIHIVYYIGTGWLIFTLYMVILLAFTDILRVFNIVIPYRFITCSVLIIITLALGYIHYTHPDVNVINIDINKPIQGNKQLRIAALSDIHLGYGTTKSRLQNYIHMVQEQHPDLILLSGDLIDSTMKPVLEEHMQEELSQLQAPLGVYMVPGNHEYHSGVKACREFVQTKTPIIWLQDSTVTLPNGLQLIGRDDKMNPKRKSLVELTRSLDPEQPIFLLDHQPYHLQQTADAGVDLQFSGHTHRGQVWPLSLVTDHLFEVSQGYKRMGNTHIYVSAGLSLWGPPFRIGTSSELVIFDVRFK